MKFGTLAAATLAVLASSVAHVRAADFTDTFDSYPAALNWAPQGGWYIPVSNSQVGGTVDVVASGTFSITCAGGAGLCIDLDGSTGKSGLLSHDFTLTGGQQYAVTFDLAGNMRGAAPNDVQVKFGDTVASFNSIASNAPFARETLTFTPGTTGTYTLSFLDSSSNNEGAILDNVTVAAVPEPGTWAMIVAGLVTVGVSMRRRLQPGLAPV